MLIEHRVPQIAKSAFTLAYAGFQGQVNELAKQTIESMGLNPADNWSVDFQSGRITREAPDTKPALVPDIGPDGVGDAAATG